MKLRAYLQHNYRLPRRAIIAAIQSESVFLNDEQVESYGQTITNGDYVTAWIDGKKIDEVVKIEAKEDRIVLFHKPEDYVCSRSDKHNRTIYEILPDSYKDFYYIGRLDKDSRGLLLLTNNSALVHRYEHPKFGIKKQYLVLVRFADQGFAQRLVGDSGQPFFDVIKGLCTKGLLVDEHGYLAKKTDDSGDLLRAVNVDDKTSEKGLLRRYGFQQKLSDKYFVLDITLVEGKKRHIRRLLSSIGGEVKDLIRTRVGDYTLDTLEKGEIANTTSDSDQ